MSTFVVQREYSLQLPNNYIEIDRAEMEYVDGGSGFTDWALSVKTVGYSINIIAAGIAGGITAVTLKLFVKKFAAWAIKIGIKKAAFVTAVPWLTFLIDSDFGLSAAQYLDSIDASPNNGIVWFGN